MLSDLTLDPLQGQTRIAKLKSVYNSLVLLFVLVVRFDLEPLLQHQTRTAKPKSGYNLLIIDPIGLQ